MKEEINQKFLAEKEIKDEAKIWKKQAKIKCKL